MAGNFNSGRRKIKEEIKKLLESEAKKSIFTMIEIRDDSEQPSGVRLNAAQYLCDRAWGKPKQATELTGGEGEPLFPDLLCKLRGLDGNSNQES